MFPLVLSVNTTKEDMANVQQDSKESIVETWVTVVKRSKVGVFRLP